MLDGEADEWLSFVFALGAKINRRINLYSVTRFLKRPLYLHSNILIVEWVS